MLFKPEGSTQVELLNKDGSVTRLGTLSPDAIAQAYTKLRGRSGAAFVFESARFERNWIGKLAMSKTQVVK